MPRGRTFPIKMTAAEFTALENTATRQGLHMAAWFRQAALAHIERVFGVVVPEEERTGKGGRPKGWKAPPKKLAA